MRYFCAERNLYLPLGEKKKSLKIILIQSRQAALEQAFSQHYLVKLPGQCSKTSTEVSFVRKKKSINLVAINS